MCVAEIYGIVALRKSNAEILVREAREKEQTSYLQTLSILLRHRLLMQDKSPCGLTANGVKSFPNFQCHSRKRYSVLNTAFLTQLT